MQEALPIAPITKADIVDELWREIARYRAGAVPMTQGRQAKLGRAPEQALAVAEMRLPLAALLALDGMAFVDAAYRTILARAPDDAGIAYFMREMAAGGSKVMLLGELQRSAEGRSAGRAIPGLRRRYVMHRAYRVPVLGGVAKIASGVLRRTGVSRRIGGPNRPRPATRRTPGAAILGMLGAAQEVIERRADEQQAAIDAIMWRVEALQTAQEQAVRAAADARATSVTQRRLSVEAQAGRSAAQTQAIDGALRRLDAQEEASQRILTATAKQGRALDELAEQNAEHARRIGAVEDSTIDALLSMSDTLADQAARLLRIERLLDGEAIAARIDEGAAALGGRLDERLRRVEAIATQNNHDLADQQRRVGLMLEALRVRKDGVSAAELEALHAQDDHMIDALYVDFENRFRGTRAVIKERQRFYLPILAEMQAGTPERPVLDVGCGRGEFLELLRDEGLVGSGVDSNVAMVEACRAMGLDCTADDALAYLARQAPNSLGAVTGFHIIEHLPFKTMVRLFDETLRVLVPGGVMIFETPNPANLLVASRWFYLDPTHRNPLPSEMVSMIAQARGFTRISIAELHPMEERFAASDTMLGEQLDRLFHGPRDYALLARRP
jgi:SAM-dependent methyltransferase